MASADPLFIISINIYFNIFREINRFRLVHFSFFQFKNLIQFEKKRCLMKDVWEEIKYGFKRDFFFRYSVIVSLGVFLGFFLGIALSF